MISLGELQGEPNPAISAITATNALARAVANNAHGIPCGWKRDDGTDDSDGQYRDIHQVGGATIRPNHANGTFHADEDE